MRSLTGSRHAFCASFILVFGAATASNAAPCVVPAAGGTAELPPAGCEYTSPDGVFLISDGLPPGTTIELAPVQNGFTCVNASGLCSLPVLPGQCEAAGGALGGNFNCGESTLSFQVAGTGALAGFSRSLSMPAFSEVHTAPRTPGDAVQSFTTDMVDLQATLFGDPDFCDFRIVAGSANGLPSPGNTTLSELASGDFNVESAFDVAYTIEFSGCPGSVLDGLGGTTPGVVQMSTGQPAGVCELPDNGAGSAGLPPAGCDYRAEPDYVIADGLPPGTTLELMAVHTDFICQDQAQRCSAGATAGVCEVIGGSLGGTLSCFESIVELEVRGTGSLSGFSRSLVLPLFNEWHIAPRVPGDPVQAFGTNLFRMSGELFGDPDFCSFSIRSGSAEGLPSPGHTTLSRLPSGNYEVESFFDITYRIDFEGCPASVLDGMAGSTPGALRLRTGVPLAVPVPLLVGGALALFALLLSGTGAFAIRQRDDSTETTRPIDHRD